MSMRGAIASLGLLLLWTGAAEAQRPGGPGGGGGGGGGAPTATAVTPVQSLDFGLLVPALAEQVTVQQSWRRAEVRLEGNGQLEIRIMLPTDLTSTAGSTIPLSFRAGDGAYVLDGSTQLSFFDPTRPVRINMKTGGAQLLLGGTATPAATQAAGNYGATVVVVLAPSSF